MSLNKEQSARLIEIHKELEAALSMSVRISGDQVMCIVATDLLSKYSAVLKRGSVNSSDAVAFEKVLCWYFSDDEIVEIKGILIDGGTLDHKYKL